MSRVELDEFHQYLRERRSGATAPPPSTRPMATTPSGNLQNTTSLLDTYRLPPWEMLMRARLRVLRHLLARSTVHGAIPVGFVSSAPLTLIDVRDRTDAMENNAGFALGGVAFNYLLREPASVTRRVLEGLGFRVAVSPPDVLSIEDGEYGFAVCLEGQGRRRRPTMFSLGDLRHRRWYTRIRNDVFAHHWGELLPSTVSEVWVVRGSIDDG